MDKLLYYSVKSNNFVLHKKKHVSLPDTIKRNIKRAKSFDTSEVEIKPIFVESETDKQYNLKGLFT